MSYMTARSGWAWFKQGAALFRKQPAGLTTLLFANILVSIVVGFIPLLGPIVAVVVIPCFSIAFMQACLLIDQDKRVTPDVLLTGFRTPAIQRLLQVGLVYLVVFFVVSLIAPVNPEIMRQAQSAQDAGAVPQVRGGDVLILLVACLLQAVTMLTLAFTAPLTCWQNMPLGKAVFYSFFAVLRAGRAFCVLLLSWFGILFGLTFVLFTLLGTGSVMRVVLMWLFFLFFLLLQCALYCAYRHIFGTPATKPVSLTKM